MKKNLKSFGELKKSRIFAIPFDESGSSLKILKDKFVQAKVPKTK